jgi:hypothetical protein
LEPLGGKKGAKRTELAITLILLLFFSIATQVVNIKETKANPRMMSLQLWVDKIVM